MAPPRRDTQSVRLLLLLALAAGCAAQRGPAQRLLRQTRKDVAALGRASDPALYEDPARLRAAVADPAWLAAELRALVAADQRVRGAFLEVWSGRVALSEEEAAAFNSELGRMMSAVDLEGTRRLKLLLAARGERWPAIGEAGAEASKNAWLLVQHADLDPAFQERALELIRPLAEVGQVDRADAAYLEDRVAVKKGVPQRFGTQVECRGGRPVPQGPEVDLAALDANRASVGLGPWGAYAEGWVKSCAGG